MDYGNNGRESAIGLTKERGPSAGDLAPGSPSGRQVWAIGWYNAEGAFGLGQVYADACNPQIPTQTGGVSWIFPNGTAAFKLLFTTASETEVPYLAGSPTVEAHIGSNQSAETLRLLQVDIGVRDPRATGTEWVMGTYIWKGPKTGDGVFDNLVPVGLMWGNDPGVHDGTFANLAPLSETRLNALLAGVVWQGAGGGWPERPFPGFQGRLNGPADNLRSSCLSCHGLAQWRRHGTLRLSPSYALSPPPDANGIQDIVSKYFKNVKGGTLNDSAVAATPLDYSLQLESAFSRMCQACNEESLTGTTPLVCKVPSNGVPGNDPIDRDTCEKSMTERATSWISGLFSEVDPQTPPRQ